MMNFEKLVGSSGRWSSYFWGRKFLTWGSRQERRNGKPRNFICHDKTQKDWFVCGSHKGGGDPYCWKVCCINFALSLGL